jgi:hypothetical protein
MKALRSLSASMSPSAEQPAKAAAHASKAGESTTKGASRRRASQEEACSVAHPESPITTCGRRNSSSPSADGAGEVNR